MASQANLRRSQQQLARLAANDIAALWRQVNNAVEARVALQDVLPALVDTYGQAAASVAADWYDEAREAAEVGGRFRAVPASVTENATDALALWATQHGTDLGAVRELVEGGLQRRIANWGRDTIVGSSLADPAADGWQRVGVGECAWCAMIISRGAVFSEATVGFAAHDSCRCVACPAFGGRPRPVEPHTPNLRYPDTPTGRARKAADQDRAKKWIAANL